MSVTPKIKLVSVLCWFAAAAAAFAFPVQVPYSGQLAENGELISGVKLMRFQIFDAEKGGVSRYESGAAPVVVNRGLFSIVLGGTNFAVLDSGVFDGTSRWLEISVAPTNSPDFTILQPRQLVHFMPQSAYAVAAGLADHAALAERVAADSVSASNLANGAVTLTKLNTAGAQPGQFLNVGQDGSTAQWAFVTLNPGPGLQGGGSNWPVSLQVDFGTNGVANTAARSDHDHQNLTNRGIFTVQYRETDFAFASRLMEEEGIYYYFKMNNAEKKVVMGSDDLRPNRVGPSVELRAGDGLGPDQSGGHLILKPGLGTGNAPDGNLLMNVRYTLFLPDGTPCRATLAVNPLENNVTLSAANTNANHDGPDLMLAAGDAAGTNRNGGHIILKPGSHSGSGAPGQVMLVGDLMVTGAVSAVSFKGDGTGLTGVNAEFLGGAPSADWARLSTSNRFTGLVEFGGPVQLEKNLLLQLEMENTMVSSYSFGPGSEPFTNVPPLLNLEAQTLPNGLNIHDGAGVRIKAGDALSGTAQGGDIRLTAGDGGEGGTGGQIILDPGKITGGGSAGKVVVAQDMMTVGGGLIVSNRLTVMGGATVAGTLTTGDIVTTNPVAAAMAKPGLATMSATPSVANATVLLLNNYFGPMDITNLLDGVEGQVVVLVGGNNPVPPVVRDNNSLVPGAFKLGRDLDWPALPDNTLTLCRINGQWLETARSDNSNVISQ